MDKVSALISQVGVYAGTFLNSAIVLATVAVQQLTTLAVYYCPCTVPSSSTNCTDDIGNAKCSRYLNFSYGLAFIVAPAVGLLVFGFATSSILWKMLTGCAKKTESQKRDFGQVLCTLLNVTAQSLIAPMAWISVAFLDGRYYACAVTDHPYDIGPTPAAYLDCAALAKSKTLYYSYTFNENRSFSQLVGWITISIAVVLGILAYGIIKCTSPLTYYQAKFYNDYRTAEENKLVEVTEAKTKTNAKEYVDIFMEKPRSKSLWDRISTVHSFHRNKKNVALYSNLHKWVLEEREKGKCEMEPLLGGNGVEEKKNLIDRTTESV